MKVLRILIAIIAAVAALTASASDWQPDVLGADFEMRYVDQPDDYSGQVRSTIVRLARQPASDAGVLYVHGYNDYFFQADMAHEVAAHGYAFYAVDLRKYGRSILDGQKMFEVRDMREYFADIDSALVQMRADGIRHIALMGHSTGGLTTALYIAEHPDTDVQALVLNSPFLDWNLSKFQERILVPMVRFISKIAPKMSIPQGDGNDYARSLLAKYDGEWNYDTAWKLEVSPAVQASWINAIDSAQGVLQHNPGITIPVLLMHSDASVAKGDEPQAYHHKDAVLDVADISRYGRQLGSNVTEVVIPGGLHDLVLSAPEARNAAYDAIFNFLNRTLRKI